MHCMRREKEFMQNLKLKQFTETPQNCTVVLDAGFINNNHPLNKIAMTKTFCINLALPCQVKLKICQLQLASNSSGF